MASNLFLALRSLPRFSGANGSVSMNKAIFTNSTNVARQTGWMPIFAASLSTNTAGDVPYAKRSSTSGSNASHTIDQSDHRMFLIHLPSRLTTTMSQYLGPSTWSAGGYIKETQPTKSVATFTMQNEIPQTLPKMVRSNNMHCIQFPIGERKHAI